MGRPIVTEEQKQFIFETREAGWSCSRIGRRLGIHAETVAWHCLAMGVLKAGRPRAVRSPTRATMRNGRNGRIVRPFLPEDDRRLLSLEAQGLSVSEICRRLGRRTSSVRNRLMTLAIREEAA